MFKDVYWLKIYNHILPLIIWGVFMYSLIFDTGIKIGGVEFFAADPTSSGEKVFLGFIMTLMLSTFILIISNYSVELNNGRFMVKFGFLPNKFDINEITQLRTVAFISREELKKYGHIYPAKNSYYKMNGSGITFDYEGILCFVKTNRPQELQSELLKYGAQKA